MSLQKIAVVHENAVALRTLIGSFAGAGYDAVGALSFGDAVALLGGYRPALLVVDVERDGYMGLHLALRAAAAAPETKIIVLGPAAAGLEEDASAGRASDHQAGFRLTADHWCVI